MALSARKPPPPTPDMIRVVIQVRGRLYEAMFTDLNASDLNTDFARLQSVIGKALADETGEVIKWGAGMGSKVVKKPPPARPGWGLREGPPTIGRKAE